jgi:glutamate/tyrosine decarboxylase-like PLP-dependent enzyme
MMPTVIQQDLQQLPGILQQALQLSVDYLNKLNEWPTSLTPESINWPGLPDDGMGALATQKMFEAVFYKQLVASSGPRYWGFVTGGTTPAAIAGDWLSTVFDQNTQSTTGVGDCSAILEMQTIKMLLQLFKLPDHFMGAFVSGATMSNFSALAVARQWVGHQQGYDIALKGMSQPIKIFSAAPHSSALKALAMLGIGSEQITKIDLLQGREAMDINALEKVLLNNNGAPCIVLASGGTVNSVDFDDFEALHKLHKKYNFWLHIDAAFGAFAACSPLYEHLLKGWQFADSITIDFHKWLNVPYDSAMIFTRKEHARLQMQSFQNAAAPYLGDPEEQFSYLNFVPENSRRFRALPVWFSLMAYGKTGYKNIVEDNIRLANELADALVNTNYFQLAAPVRLNTVCFALQPYYAAQIDQHKLLQAINATGKVFMTPSAYHGKPCIRAALVNYRTSAEDIQLAVSSIKTTILSFIDANQ